jgi:hypothetical protein
MPAARRSCIVCACDFHGRRDARYCSTACRQKAYRRRSRNAPPVTPPVANGSVLTGDEWMRDRFGHSPHMGYVPVAERPAHVPTARHRAAEETIGLETIRDYVQGLACIGRQRYDDDAGCVIGQDLQTPLGNTLPDEIDPATAARLATELRDAIPRVLELASLLEGRGRMTPVPMKLPIDAAHLFATGAEADRP